MRVTDLNQDVNKLKKILHKYEEKFGKLERKKQAHEVNLNNSVDSSNNKGRGTEKANKSPNGEENCNSNNAGHF